MRLGKTQQDRGGDPGVAYEYNFTYDAAGNRTTWQVVGGATTNYTYDDANKMTSPGAFTYDDAGNTLTRVVGGVTTTYTWDYLNRLTEWQKTGETTQTYVYNGGYNRVSKSSAGTMTQYLLDGKEVVEDITGSNVTSYVGPGLISKIVSTTRTIYHADGLGGSTRAITSGDQSVAAATIYDAYGNLRADYPVASNPNFGFAGQLRYRTDSTGLDYLKLRYYYPEVGRFISRDPAYYRGGLNLYAYVSGNPVNKFDPLGLGPFDWLLPSPICNWSSDQCMIVQYDDNGSQYNLLKPGECTSFWRDQGDYLWKNGHWYKCSGWDLLCYIDDRPPDGPWDIGPVPPGEYTPPPPSAGMCKAYCDCQRKSKYWGSMDDNKCCEQKRQGK